MSKKFAFLIIFVCLLLVSFYFINNDKKTVYVDTDSEVGLSVDDLYDENSLIFNEKEEQINDVSCSYLQIEGLKKAKVENNINKDIKNKIYQIANNGQYNHLDMIVSASFSNILSFVINAYDENNISVEYYLNYNLVTGEQLLLADLFTKSEKFVDIINDNIRINILNQKNNNCNIDDFGNISGKSQICYDLNEKYLHYMYEFSLNNYDFYFNDLYVYIKIDDLTISILYFDYPDVFSLYNKFLTNVSIFKDDSIGKKNILTASYRKNGVLSILDYLSENVFVDSVIFTSDNSIDEKVVSGISNVIDELNNSLSTSNMFSFINQSGFINLFPSDDNEYKIYNLSIDTYNYNMSSDYFDKNIYNKIFNLHRVFKDVNDNSNLIDLSYSNFVSKEHKNYSYIVLANGEILNEISDLFDPEYDYKSLIVDLILKNNNISKEEVLSTLKLDYYLDTNNAYSYSILATGSGFNSLSVPFSYFDKEMINIY